MIMPVIPIIQVDKLHISTNHINLLANLTQITAAVAYFYWGRYVDRHSPLKAVVVNILLNAFIPVFYLVAESKWMLAPAFFLAGITQAGIDLSYFNSILSFASEENASRYQALHSFLLGIRGVIAPVAGGLMVELLRQNGLDFRWLFLVALSFILAGCWMQVMGIRRREREGAKQVAYT
jgi:MFS family permease